MTSGQIDELLKLVAPISTLLIALAALVQSRAAKNHSKEAQHETSQTRQRVEHLENGTIAAKIDQRFRELGFDLAEMLQAAESYPPAKPAQPPHTTTTQNTTTEERIQRVQN